MRSLVVTVLVPLVTCAALTGCSPVSSSSPTGAPTPTLAASPSPEDTTGASAPSEAGSVNGTITFSGALSGTMTVSACHDGMAQLVVTVTGEKQTYAGLIDADDFTFAVPHSTGYTLADGTSKPKVSGTTYTVEDTKLVSITNDDAVTANGSVTCP